MNTVIASNLEQARELIESGTFKKVELAFDIDSDTFFNFAAEYCDHGAKLVRHDDHFVVKLPEMDIPSNH